VAELAGGALGWARSFEASRSARAILRAMDLAQAKLPRAPAPTADFAPAVGVSFFGRIRQLDFACPRCNRVYRLSEFRTSKRIWDPSTGYFECADCELSLILGILAWHPPTGLRRIPDDHLPQSFRQALQLRELAKNVLRGERIPGGKRLNRKAARKGRFIDKARSPAYPTNRLAPVACTCYVEIRKDRQCSIHGERVR